MQALEYITSIIFSLVIPEAFALSPTREETLELIREDKIDLLKQILSLYGLPIAIVVIVVIVSFLIYRANRKR